MLYRRDAYLQSTFLVLVWVARDIHNKINFYFYRYEFSAIKICACLALLLLLKIFLLKIRIIKIKKDNLNFRLCSTL